MERQKFYSSYVDILNFFFQFIKENTKIEVIYQNYEKGIIIKDHEYFLIDSFSYTRTPSTPLSSMLDILTFTHKTPLLDLLCSSKINHPVRYQYLKDNLPIPAQFLFQNKAIPGYLYSELLTHPIKKYNDIMQLSIYEYFVFLFLKHPSEVETKRY